MSATLKRLARGPSSDELLKADDLQVAAKRRDTLKGVSAVAPLLAPTTGESQSAFFARLAARLRSCPLLSLATNFERDGLYIYKRPVRSASGDKAALLASAGTVFHHVVLYIKQGEELTALEFGPASGMDITDNMLAEAAAAPVILPAPAPAPEPQHLPMLHLAVAHHPLASARVQEALRFAEGTPYHALRNNCIAFADFAVRVLTGGAVRGAPLAFDALVGQVPAVESPLLGLLGLTTGMRWHDVCDGGRMMRQYLERYPNGLLPPVPGAEALELAGEAEEDAEAATVVGPATSGGAPSAPPAFNPAMLSALASLLPPGGLPGLQATLAGLTPSAAGPATQPSESSGCSEDTVAGVAATGAASASADAAPAAASLGSSLASTGTSRKPAGGPALPPRSKASRAAA